MDIKSNYMGLALSSPIVVSASPISEKVENIKKCEDAGAGAIVLYSLFEEQLEHEQYSLHYHTTVGTYSFAESLTYFPDWDEYRLEPDKYLELIRKAKEAVKMPVIASLNGKTIGGWTEFAKKMQDAGADAIELNVYFTPTDINKTGLDIENTYIDILKAVKSYVSIPVAIKISPYFSNIANMANRLDEAGANALVLFNRFYQPDINLEELEVVPNLVLSNSSDIRLPLRWIAILYKQLKADLAATSGIHTGEDAAKILLSGAKAIQICSSLLKNGINHIKDVENGLTRFMEEKEYESVAQMQGVMSHFNMKTKDASPYERAQYMKTLTNYKF